VQDKSSQDGNGVDQDQLDHKFYKKLQIEATHFETESDEKASFITVKTHFFEVEPRSTSFFVMQLL
jgi:hypothetical protein